MYTRFVLRESVSTRTAIRCCIEPVRRNVLPLCRRVIRHKARVNARESLHKGCGERDEDGVALHRAAGKRKSERKREKEDAMPFRSCTQYIVNLEAADIELDDDYRVARYSKYRER